ncbi:hypothetical protein HYPSUDRAFT_202161 [Hypholoma sublateritium FD-334 SS-4]|uniref:Uncharacterized protein n=1 Tax=Hypholoma sublateritium (strain FD-334 SS-4) TaxID=945553 RepID=A0A0D2MFI4_HYPSF|nr:hypothetical protein HYPSUDRAFT_202161 [Hypholoma sublateritium FD-334 SS-4]
MRTVHEMWPLSPSISARSLPLFLSSSPLFAAARALSTPSHVVLAVHHACSSPELAVHRARPPSSSPSATLAQRSPSLELAVRHARPSPELTVPSAPPRDRRPPRPPRSTSCAHKPSCALTVPCAAWPAVAPRTHFPHAHRLPPSHAPTMPPSQHSPRSPPPALAASRARCSPPSRAPCTRAHRAPSPDLASRAPPSTRAYLAPPTSKPPSPRLAASLLHPYPARRPRAHHARPPSTPARRPRPPRHPRAPSSPSCTPPPAPVPPIPTTRFLSTSLDPRNVPSRPAIPPPPRNITHPPSSRAHPPPAPLLHISQLLVWWRYLSPALVDCAPPFAEYLCFLREAGGPSVRRSLKMTCTRGKFIFTLYLCHHPRSPLALRTFLSLLHASAVSSYEDAINQQSSDIGVAGRHENRQRLEGAGGNGWGSVWVGKDISSCSP